MVKFSEHINIVADACKSTIEQMTRLDVVEATVKRVQQRVEVLPFAHIITYTDLDKKVDGSFILAFEDVDASLTLASAIAERLGIGRFDNICDDTTDLLNEFLNVVVGRSISEWDNIGLRVSFGVPELQTDYNQKQQKNIQSYAIVLQVKFKVVDLANDGVPVNRIVLRIDFMETPPVYLLENKRIMVVEDSSVMRRITANALKDSGAIIKEAKDGEEAVRFYKLFKPDLTLMDINMPKMNGLDAIANIKEFDPKAKFIILSSSSKKDEILKAQTLGVRGYLVKPFDTEELLKRVTEKI